MSGVPKALRIPRYRDLRCDLVMYYHTQHNRRVRQVDLKKIDFASSKVLIHQALDKVKAEDIEDVTPGSK